MAKEKPKHAGMVAAYNYAESVIYFKMLWTSNGGGAMSNRQMEEKAEQRQAETIAEELEITVDELEQTGYNIEEVTSEDGVPYYILVQFSDYAPQEILDKIDGLDGNSVRLDANIFDS